MSTNFLINRSNIRDIKVVEGESAADLQPNQIRCQIDQVAFTANNITYAVAGDFMKYWDFFPAPDGWGKLPVWGFADVVASEHPDIAIGERIYGYWPLATHLTIDADQVRSSSFVDAAPHRQHLNGIYNSYSRTASSPGFAPELEHLNALLRPLFTTSFLIDDFLDDNEFFGAEVVIISSASSKTAMGTAFQLHSNRAARGSDVQVIGLTSASNVAFVEGLGWYDQVVAYDDVTEISAETKAAYIDIAGNGQLRSTVHHHFTDTLVHSSAVGVSHWEKPAFGTELPGARSTLFFAPAQAQKRLKEWGPAQFGQKTAEASQQFYQVAAQLLDITIGTGTEEILDIYASMVEGDIPPNQAFMLKL
ncbi:MAG: DUF2855 family protein [Chloroflexota bacterium]